MINISLINFYHWYRINVCRWGGVVLINPLNENCENTTEDEAVAIIPEETAVMGTFLAQLRLLLGITETVKAISYNVLYKSFY